MRSPRTQFMSWRIISRLIQSTIWKTNSRSHCCASLSRFWARKPPLYVRRIYNFLGVSTVLRVPITVSGEHTRTIQIATPTVGGLMKFAVKTVTCLGCKTPLRANNSVGSAYRLRRPYSTKSSSSPDRWCRLR